MRSKTKNQQPFPLREDHQSITERLRIFFFFLGSTILSPPKAHGEINKGLCSSVLSTPVPCVCHSIAFFSSLSLSIAPLRHPKRTFPSRSFAVLCSRQERFRLFSALQKSGQLCFLLEAFLLILPTHQSAVLPLRALTLSLHRQQS